MHRALIKLWTHILNSVVSSIFGVWLHAKMRIFYFPPLSLFLSPLLCSSLALEELIQFTKTVEISSRKKQPKRFLLGYWAKIDLPYGQLEGGGGIAWPGAVPATGWKEGSAEKLILAVRIIFFTFVFQLRLRQSPEVVAGEQGSTWLVVRRESRDVANGN